MSKSASSAGRDRRAARRPEGHRPRRSARRSPTPSGRSASTRRPSRASPTCWRSTPRSPGGRSPRSRASTPGAGYGDLKKDLAEVVAEFVSPLRERVRAYLDDPAELDRVLARGAERAREVAGVDARRRPREDRLPAARRLLGAPRDRCIGPGRGRPGCVGRAASERVAAEARAGERKDGDAKPSKLEQLRARYAWLDHLVRAGTRYTEHHGDHYAAAITFFSVLSLVPLLMIAFAVAGYVLFFNPNAAERDPQTRSTRALPPNLADTINPIIDQAIAQRGTVGRVRPARRAVLRASAGCRTCARRCRSSGRRCRSRRRCPSGCCSTCSRCSGSASRWSARSRSPARRPGSPRTLLELVGLADQGWAQFLLGVLGVLLGLTANWLIFLWVIARLPREHATAAQRREGRAVRRGRLRGAQAGHDLSTWRA